MGDYGRSLYVRNYRCEDLQFRHKYSSGRYSTNGESLLLNGVGASGLTSLNGSRNSSGRSTPTNSFPENGSSQVFLTATIGVGFRVGVGVGPTAGFTRTSTSQVNLCNSSSTKWGLSRPSSYSPSFQGRGRCSSADPADLVRRAYSSKSYTSPIPTFLKRNQSPLTYYPPSSRSASADRQGSVATPISFSLIPSYHRSPSTVVELARNVSTYNWEKSSAEDDYDSGLSLHRGLGSASSMSVTDSETETSRTLQGSTSTLCTDLDSFTSFGQSSQYSFSEQSNGTKGRQRKAICEKGYYHQRHLSAPIFPSTLTTEEENTLARAEARLAVRRQARAEAREIRMKELEKQQKENEDNSDKHDPFSPSPSGGAGDVVNRAAFRVALGNHHHRTSAHSIGSASYHSSRRSSEDSTEDGVINMRELRQDLKELEEKFRKSMVQNAQLDNEKSALTYQVELLKDKIEDLEESLSLLQREHRDKSRDFENLKRLSNQIKEELEYYKAQLNERNELIKEYGLVVVENEVEVEVENGVKETRIKRTLVSQETATILSSLGQGPLDVRLNKVLEEKNELADEIRRLRMELEEERNRSLKGPPGLNNNLNNHYDDGENETEASKKIAEYRLKTQKYEQEIAALQANVARLDTQVHRYKTAAEEAEAREDDLKVERRKLQRELREAQSKLDEVETTNSHLQKRLDKLKTAKSTLLKEL